MVDETEFDIMDAEENEELADCLSEAFGIEVNDMDYNTLYELINKTGFTTSDQTDTLVNLIVNKQQAEIDELLGMLEDADREITLSDKAYYRVKGYIYAPDSKARKRKELIAKYRGEG